MADEIAVRIGVALGATNGTSATKGD